VVKGVDGRVMGREYPLPWGGGVPLPGEGVWRRWESNGEGVSSPLGRGCPPPCGGGVPLPVEGVSPSPAD